VLQQQETMAPSLQEQDSLLGQQQQQQLQNQNEKKEEDSILRMDDAIDRLGFGLFHYRLLCFGLLVFVLLLSSVFCGALPGSLVLGQAADNYGRKPIFILSAAMIAIFGIATATATDFKWLVACRWGVGFKVGDALF
jgi:MFS family permease